MGDLIIREQAIELLNLNKPNVDEQTKYAMWQFDKDLQTIKTMPSAEKTGKWIWIDGVRCSRCNYKLQSTGLSSYCPNCGARLVKED